MRERARPPAARLLTGAAARARRGLRTGEQAKAVRALERAGAAVAVSTLDVVDAGEAAALLALAGRAAPVAAVFHLAMYLDDRLLASQARAHVAGAGLRGLGSAACARAPGQPPPAGQARAPLVLGVYQRFYEQTCSELYCTHMLRPWGPLLAGAPTPRPGAQTGESWNKVVRPKALGAWNLDAATRGLADLEHFICFSSIVASLGNAGAPRARAFIRQGVVSYVQSCLGNMLAGVCLRSASDKPGAA